MQIVDFFSKPTSSREDHVPALVGGTSQGTVWKLPAWDVTLSVVKSVEVLVLPHGLRPRDEFIHCHHLV